MIGKTFTAAIVTTGLFACVAAHATAQSATSLDGSWGSGTLVVVSGGADEALLIDPFTRRLLGRFPTGPDPREVALSPDGRFAYVTSFGWTPPDGAAPGTQDSDEEPPPMAASGARAVTVLDLAQRRVHAVFQPRDYRNLEAIRVADDGQRLWMTADDGGIVELDAHTGEVKMLWQSGGANPGTLTVTRDSRRIWVASTGSDLVTMIDRVTVVPSHVETGRRPEGLALSPNESEVWVANSGDHTISVINARRLKEEARFSSGGVGPTRLRFNPAGNEVWVSHRGTQEVTVLDVASGAVIARIPIEGEPRSLVFSDDGRRVLVSVPARHLVYMLDVEAREVIGSLDAGRLPAGVAWSEHDRTRGR